MPRIREAAVAGLFYPEDPRILQQEVSAYLENNCRDSPCRPRALIVPHAGYVYSGPVAATAYNLLAPLRGQIRTVLLFGPAHRVGFRGIAASSADYFRTPLGDISVDRQAIDRLLAESSVQLLDEAHAEEHSLEVQLPFLQTVLEQFSLIPLVVGDARAESVAQVIEMAWDDEETLILISSDLSHYHDYDAARTIDQATAQAIQALAYEKIGYDQACGRTPVNGLLLAAQKHDLHPRQLDLRNSGDTAGMKDRVVGYGAWAFCR